MAEILREENALEAACRLLAVGEPVAIPTETVYGLAADATNGEAVARIFEAKGRPRFNPLIAHVADREMAERIAVFSPLAERLAKTFWPGPLTLVLPRREDSGIHPLVTAGLDTIALRCPQGFGAKVITRLGRPLAAPSANISGRVTGTTAEAVNAALGGRISLIVDGGPAKVGLESTIVKVEDDTLTLLRPGGLAVEEIERVAGVPVKRGAKGVLAPGMLASHYAPQARIRLDVAEVLPGEALLAFGPDRARAAEKAAVTLNLSPSGDLREAAANLFAHLSALDAAGSPTIAVEPVPRHGLGEAINDRLARAAAPRDNHGQEALALSMDTHPEMLDPALMERFVAIVGERHALKDPGDIAPHLVEPRGLWGGRSLLVLKPGSTEEVSRIMKLATETGTPIVPQGGNTGLVGGQMPDGTGREVILSTARLNRIREIDLSSNTATVEAGVVLQVLQEEAARNDRLFPLSLGSQGSCQIGGNLSSNAGGVGALAYGVARDLCLGLEVVLPTGEIFDDLRKLKKDNTGYDLKDLFIGAEGTLGVITAAVVKLYPMPKGRELAWVGLGSPVDALRLFELANEKAGTALTMFELMERTALDFVLRHVPSARAPLAESHPWNAMLEISSGRSAEDARTLMEDILAAGFEAGWAADAVLAQNESQQLQLRQLREDMSDAQRPEGGSIKHDISVPVAAVPEFITRADEVVQQVVPGVRPVCFGHMGDGNLHYNISQPVGASKEEYLTHYRAMNDAVHAVVRSLGGSFSAEHGIGRLKRAELLATQPAVATDLMRRVKTAFDPAGIMNPGKVI